MDIQLSAQQQAVVGCNEPRIVVKACPGSGKTFSVAARMAKLLRENNLGIVVFCFCFDRSRRLIPSVSAFSPSNLRFYISIRSFRPDYLSIRYDRGVVPP